VTRTAVRCWQREAEEEKEEKAEKERVTET
jgi:hypothetical protein